MLLLFQYYFEKSRMALFNFLCINVNSFYLSNGTIDNTSSDLTEPGIELGHPALRPITRLILALDY